MTNLELKELKSFAHKTLKSLNKNVPVDEVINEAYLRVYDKNKQIKFPNIKGEIINVIHRYINKEHLIYDYPISNKINDPLEEKHCKSCLTIKSISFFHIKRKYPSGVITYQSYCKECQKLSNYNNYKKRMKNPIYRENQLSKWREKSKQFYKTIRSNPKLKEYYNRIKKEINRKHRAKKKLIQLGFS